MAVHRVVDLAAAMVALALLSSVSALYMSIIGGVHHSLYQSRVSSAVAQYALWHSLIREAGPGGVLESGGKLGSIVRNAVETFDTVIACGYNGTGFPGIVARVQYNGKDIGVQGALPCPYSAQRAVSRALYFKDIAEGNPLPVEEATYPPDLKGLPVAVSYSMSTLYAAKPPTGNFIEMNLTMIEIDVGG